MSKYNKENLETLYSLSVTEFFDHLEAVIFYEDLEYSAYKDQELANKMRK